MQAYRLSTKDRQRPVTANKTLTLLLEAIESAFSTKIVVRSLTICGFLASIMVMVVQVLSTTDRIDMMVYRSGGAETE